MISFEILCEQTHHKKRCDFVLRNDIFNQEVQLKDNLLVNFYLALLMRLTNLVTEENLNNDIKILEQMVQSIILQQYMV